MTKQRLTKIFATKTIYLTHIIWRLYQIDINKIINLILLHANTNTIKLCSFKKVCIVLVPDMDISILSVPNEFFIYAHTKILVTIYIFYFPFS